MLHYYNIGKHTVQICRTGDRINSTIGYLVSDVQMDNSDWQFDSLGLIFTEAELQEILDKLASSNKNKPKINVKLLPGKHTLGKNISVIVCDNDDEK